MKRVLAFLISFLLAGTVNAQETKESPYEVTPEIEIPVTIGMFAAAGLPRLLEGPSAYCGTECDPNDVNGFDRTVIGWHSSNANMVSNVSFVVGMIIPFAAATVDTLATDPADGWVGYGTDVLVMSETLVAALALNNLIDMAVHRPRPLAYDHKNFTPEQRLEKNSAFSFPSGHTSAVFALGTAYSRLYMLRHPDSPYIVPIWIGTYSLGVGTALGRVFAGEHFWTDVLAGAGLGIATGLFVPWVHEVGDKKVSVLPTPYNKGAGLTVQVF